MKNSIITKLIFLVFFFLISSQFLYSQTISQNVKSLEIFETQKIRFNKINPDSIFIFGDPVYLRLFKYMSLRNC